MNSKIHINLNKPNESKNLVDILQSQGFKPINNHYSKVVPLNNLEYESWRDLRSFPINGGFSSNKFYVDAKISDCNNCIKIDDVYKTSSKSKIPVVGREFEFIRKKLYEFLAVFEVEY